MVYRTELARIRNDLAITLHHLGDDQGCRRTLEPLRGLADAPDEDLAAGEPALHDTYVELAKATRTNLKLCRADQTRAAH